VIGARALVATVILLAPSIASAQDTRDAGTSTRAGDSTARLRPEIADLELIASGLAPASFAVEALFEVDLLDEKAVAARTRVLREAQRAATSTRTMAATSTAPHPLPSDLRLERDRLRLAILGLPRERRVALVEADRARKKLADEKAEAIRERREAEEAERRAEEARLAALEEARRAESAAARAIASERARIEAQKSAIAALRAEIAETRGEEIADESATAAEIERFASEVAAATPASTESDRLYDEIVDALSVLRAKLDGALTELNAPSRVPRFRSEIDLQDVMPALETKRDELAQALDDVRDETTRLEDLEAGARLERAGRRFAQAERLNDLRIRLLARLTEDKREDVLGFTSAGFDQLAREIDQLRLSARWYPKGRVLALRGLRALVGDLFTLGVASFKFLGMLLLVGAVVVFKRRHAAWIQSARAFVLARTTRRALGLKLDRWFAAFSAVAWEASLLIATYVLFDDILGPTGVGEIEVLRGLLLAWGWYRLALAALHRLFTSAVEVRSAVPKELSEKIFLSIQMIGRYVFVVSCFLIVSEAILGRGYLYRLAVDFAWVGAIPIAYGRQRSDPEVRLRPSVLEPEDHPGGGHAARSPRRPRSDEGAAGARVLARLGERLDGADRVRSRRRAPANHRRLASGEDARSVRALRAFDRDEALADRIADGLRELDRVRNSR